MNRRVFVCLLLAATPAVADWRRDNKEECARIDEKLKEIQAMLAHTGSKITLQSMVFEPANRVIYLAAGADAAHKESSRLDLRLYFGR